MTTLLGCKVGSFKNVPQCIELICKKDEATQLKIHFVTSSNVSFFAIVPEAEFLCVGLNHMLTRNNSENIRIKRAVKL